MSMVSEIRRLKEQRDRLRAALDKVQRILQSRELIGQQQIANLHGFLYHGEVFTKKDYEAAIADVPPQTKADQEAG